MESATVLPAMNPDWGTYAQIIATLFVALVIEGGKLRPDSEMGKFKRGLAFWFGALGGAVLMIDGIMLSGFEMGGSDLANAFNLTFSVLNIIYIFFLGSTVSFLFLSDVAARRRRLAPEPSEGEPERA